MNQSKLDSAIKDVIRLKRQEEMKEKEIKYLSQALQSDQKLRLGFIHDIDQMTATTDETCEYSEENYQSPLKNLVIRT